MIIISWCWRHFLLQNINIFFMCSVVKIPTFLTYNVLVKTNLCVCCVLFAFWVKGQSCWNGQEIASTSDSLTVYTSRFRVIWGHHPFCYRPHLCSTAEIKHMSDSTLWAPENKEIILKSLYKLKMQGHTNTTGSFGAVTCSTNGYIVLVGKWAAGRLFPALEAPVTNSLRKALMTCPPTPTVFKPTSVTVQVCSCKGYSIPGCTWCNHPKAWKQFHGLN